MLNPHNFDQFNLQERIELVRLRGEYLGHTKRNCNFVDLYSVDKYLIEVNHNASLFKIDGICIVNPKDKRLEEYADKINISDAFKNQ